MMRILTLFALLTSTVAVAQFQPPQISRSNNLVSTIPSLAGWHGGFAVQAGVQSWRLDSPDLISTSVDGYFKPMRTAIMADFTNHDAGYNTRQSFQLAISPKIVLNEWVIAPSVGVLHQSHDREPTPGIYGTSGFNWSWYAFQAGLTVHFKNAFVGVDYQHHFFEPYLYRYYGRTTFIAGTQINLGQVTLLPIVQLTPKIEFGTIEATLAINSVYKGVHFGLSFDYDYGMNTAIGYDFMETVRLSYAFKTLNLLTEYRDVRQHNIGLRLLFWTKQENVQMENLGIL